MVSVPAGLRWSAENLNTPVALPAASGGTGTLEYTLVEDGTSGLPTGFSFDESSRELSSTTAVSTADSPYSLVYTVKDVNGASYSANFDVTVLVAQSFVSSQTDWSGRRGMRTRRVKLPGASGGTAPLSYSLKLSDGSLLPTGLVFTESSQQLSSTTAVVAGSHTLRYTVDDSTDISVYQDFAVTVNEAVSLVFGSGWLEVVGRELEHAGGVACRVGGHGHAGVHVGGGRHVGAADGVLVRRVVAGAVEHYGCEHGRLSVFVGVHGERRQRGVVFGELRCDGAGGAVVRFEPDRTGVDGGACEHAGEVAWGVGGHGAFVVFVEVV